MNTNKEYSEKIETTNNDNENNLENNKFLDLPTFQPPNYYDINAFKSENLGKFVWWQKNTSGQVIDIIFYSQSVEKLYKTKPLTYISYLINYTGEGSLSNLLIKKKLATKLDSGFISSRKDFSLFAISIQLTKKGLDNTNEVISLTFKFIKLIRDSPIQQSIFNEIKSMELTKFNFLDKNNDLGQYLSTLGKSLFMYDYEDILNNDYLYENYNSTLIENFRDKLIPQNSIILLGSNNYPEGLKFNTKNATEIWYNTTYNSRSLLSEQLANLQNGKYTETSNENYLFSQEKVISIEAANFNLRPQNEYLSSEKSLVPCIKDKYKLKEVEFCSKEKEDITPELKVNSTNINMWFKLDRSFNLPKINSFWQIIVDYKNIIDFLTLIIFSNHLDNFVTTQLAQAIEGGNSINIDLNEK